MLLTYGVPKQSRQWILQGAGEACSSGADGFSGTHIIWHLPKEVIWGRLLLIDTQRCVSQSESVPDKLSVTNWIDWLGKKLIHWGDLLINSTGVKAVSGSYLSPWLQTNQSLPTIVGIFTILSKDPIFFSKLCKWTGRFWLYFNVFISFCIVSSLRVRTLFTLLFTSSPEIDKCFSKLNSGSQALR